MADVNPSFTPRGYAKFEFGDFGWHLLNNANWDLLDMDLAALFAQVTGNVFVTADQFFDVSGKVPAAQEVVGDAPVTRLIGGSDTGYGAIFILPTGFSSAGMLKLKAKVSMTSVGAGFVRFSIETRINGAPAGPAEIFDFTPTSTIANRREVVEIIDYDQYDFDEEDDVVIIVERLGTADTHAGDADVLAMMMSIS